MVKVFLFNRVISILFYTHRTCEIFNFSQFFLRYHTRHSNIKQINFEYTIGPHVYRPIIATIFLRIFYYGGTEVLLLAKFSHYFDVTFRRLIYFP